MSQPSFTPTRSPTASALDEARRFDLLREQDNKPLMPPPSLRGFLVQGRLPERLVPDAEREWQKALDDIAGGAGFVAEERAFFLTLLLVGHHADDPRRLRELLEPGAARLTHHRFKQYLYCALANVASRELDPRRAREWIELCDPRSDDLLADSAYRTSSALLALVERDWDAALRQLGERLDDIPIADSYDGLAALFRAHALERRGDVDAAVAQLTHYLGGAPGRRARAEQALQLYARLRLCADSFPRVAAALPAASPTGRRRGPWRFLLSIHTIIGLGFLTAAFFVDEHALTDDGFSLRWFFVVMGASFAGLPLLIGLVMRLGGGRRRRVLAHGLDGVGEVIDVRQTGVYVNKQPRMAIRLRVTEGLEPPFEAEVRTIVPLHQVGHITPGLNLPVKIDPKDRNRVFLIPK